MPFQLDFACIEDAPRITDIHMQAFSSNVLIRTIHAQDTDLANWKVVVEEKCRADILDPKISVLVARHVADGSAALPVPASGTEVGVQIEREGKAEKEEADVQVGNERGEIIGFAKWSHPIFEAEGYVPAPWRITEDADWDVLGPWLERVGEVETRVIGKRPRYELTYLAILPTYVRLGAGKLLVQWALDKCDEEGFPAYVESTVEAVGFYKKLGFEERGRIGMDLGGEIGLYEEVGCVYSTHRVEREG